MSSEEEKDRAGFVAPLPGDRASFEALMEEHGDFLRSVIENEIDERLRTVLDTEQVVDDVSVTAYRAIGNADLPTAASFRRWLERLIVERLADLSERHVGGQTTTDAWRDQEHPSVLATKRDAAEALERVLARIPAQEREMIRLIQVERLPLREIAARTGKKPAAVRRSIVRALEACRNALAEEVQGA